MKYRKNSEGIYLQFPERVIPAGMMVLYLHDAKTGKLKDFQQVKNTFVTAGKNSLAQVLREVENKGKITYCAVGTGSTAPELTDTTLEAEIARKLISTREQSEGAENASLFTTFFNTAEGNGSLEEFGLFGDAATAAADSGTLFARTLASRVKSSSDTLTVGWTVIIG